MNEVNFSVRISPERSRKIDVHLAKIGKSKTALIEHVIDNIEKLRPALDCATATPKRGRK